VKGEKRRAKSENLTLHPSPCPLPPSNFPYAGTTTTGRVTLTAFDPFSLWVVVMTYTLKLAMFPAAASPAAVKNSSGLPGAKLNADLLPWIEGRFRQTDENFL